MEFYEGGLRDTQLLGVGQSMSEIVRYVGGNDLATAHPLERLSEKPVRRLVVASIYALGKFVPERSCLMIGRAYGIEAVALGLFNVFGPGQALSTPYTGALANSGARWWDEARTAPPSRRRRRWWRRTSTPCSTAASTAS